MTRRGHLSNPSLVVCLQTCLQMCQSISYLQTGALLDHEIQLKKAAQKKEREGGEREGVRERKDGEK